MGVSVSYYIGGLTDPAAHYEIGGSAFFMQNAEEPSYHLNTIQLQGDTLRAFFSPDDGLPEAIRAARPNYMRFYPNESLDIRVMESLYEGDRTIQFVYFYDCIRKDGQLRFRRRTISRTLLGSARAACYVGIGSEYDKLISVDGFKHVSTEDGLFSDLGI